MEMVIQSDSRDQTPNVDLLTGFLPDIDLFSLLRPESAQSLKFWDARTIVLDRHKFFERLVIIRVLSMVLANLRSDILACFDLIAFLSIVR